MEVLQNADEKQVREHMTDLTIAAQHIIYDPKRAKQLLGMMSTKTGILNAVHTVLGGIDQTKPLGRDEAVLLAPIVLMLMADLGKEVSGKKPDPKLLQEMTKSVMMDAKDTYAISKGSAPQQAQQPAQPQPPTGLLQGAM